MGNEKGSGDDAPVFDFEAEQARAQERAMMDSALEGTQESARAYAAKLFDAISLIREELEGDDDFWDEPNEYLPAIVKEALVKAGIDPKQLLDADIERLV